MKRKGFTLIELLAVIVVLGVIALIAVPLVNNSIKKSEDTAYQEAITMIEESARSWASENIYQLPTEENPTKTLTLEFLIQNGYIKSDIKNPKTEKPFENTTVVITYDNGGFNYEVQVDNAAA